MALGLLGVMVVCVMRLEIMSIGSFLSLHFFHVLSINCLHFSFLRCHDRVQKHLVFFLHMKKCLFASFKAWTEENEQRHFCIVTAWICFVRSANSLYKRNIQQALWCSRALCHSCHGESNELWFDYEKVHHFSFSCLHHKSSTSFILWLNVMLCL